MFITGVALVGIFTAAVATYFISSNDEKPKVEELIEAESSSVAHDLATMKASIDGLYARTHLSACTPQRVDRASADNGGRSGKE